MFIIVFLVVVAILLITPKKREIQGGNLLYHTVIESNKTLIITEEVNFKSSVDCIKNYNNLVFRFSKCAAGYEWNSWTHNTFSTSKNSVELFRYGNHIKLRKTILK